MSWLADEVFGLFAHQGNFAQSDYVLDKRLEAVDEEPRHL